MNRVEENYCTECDWSVKSADHSVHERTQLAIEHAVSTGHDIDSVPNIESPLKDTFPTES